MKELEVRTVLLVKAIESASKGSALLTDVQRQNASEVAFAACPRPSSESKRNEWAERFLAKRATRLLDEATVGGRRTLGSFLRLAQIHASSRNRRMIVFPLTNVMNKRLHLN